MAAQVLPELAYEVIHRFCVEMRPLMIIRSWYTHYHQTVLR